MTSHRRSEVERWKAAVAKILRGADLRDAEAEFQKQHATEVIKTTFGVEG